MDSHNFRKYSFKYIIPITLFCIISISFFYGWFFDDSHSGGKRWADQSAYRKTAVLFAHFKLPKRLQYQVGYPLLGAVGYYITPRSPFMPVSYILLLSSFFLLYYGAKEKFNIFFLLLFLLMVFFWNLETIKLNYPSEIFHIPWNNQMIFFIFCYYFWLFNFWENKKIPIGLFILTAFLSGYSVATREETILFILPLAIKFLIVKKCSYRIYLLFFGVFAIGYLPQLIIKHQVLGNILDTGRDDYHDGESYIVKLATYFSVERLAVNTVEVLFDSGLSEAENTGRLSILQSSPWLWLTPFGVLYYFMKNDENTTMKVFILTSIAFFVFYLGGINMSAHKLKYHCIRYVTPAYVALNFVVVCLIHGLYKKFWNLFSNRFETLKNRANRKSFVRFEADQLIPRKLKKCL